MGAHRYFYNQAVHFYYTHDMKCTLKELRSALLSGDALHQHEPWLNTIPFDIKDEGLRDFMKALSTNRNTKTSFHMRFKCKKDHKDGFVLHTKHWKHHKGSYASLHDIQASEDLPSELPSDTRVVYHDGQRFVLKLSVRATENQSRCTSLPSDSKRHVVALDPGIRTFMTGYDPDGYTFEWGYMDYRRLYRLYACTTRLQSLANHPNTKQHKRRRLMKLILRLHRRIRNLVKDCHYKLSKFLTETYQIIMILIFKVKDMIRGKRLNRKTKQSMSMWSHFTFRQRLISKAKQVGCTVDVVTEEYTSRTCTGCGVLNPKSSSKVKWCPKCHILC